jgi:hypothetical protein
LIFAMSNFEGIGARLLKNGCDYCEWNQWRSSLETEWIRNQIMKVRQDKKMKVSTLFRMRLDDAIKFIKAQGY